MRVNRKRGEPQKLRPRELVRTEIPPNEWQLKLGIDDKLKAKMLEVQTFGTLDKRTVQKGEAVLHLLTLFPEGRHLATTELKEKLRQVAEANQHWTPKSQLQAADILSRLGMVTGVTDKQKEKFLGLTVPTSSLGLQDSDFLESLDARVRCRQLFGESELPVMDPALDEWINQIDWEQAAKYAGGFLLYAETFLRYDPKLHPELHKLALRREEEIKGVLKRLAEVSEAENFHRVLGEYATFKLLLANEIRISPIGILLAGDATELPKTAELPEREII